MKVKELRGKARPQFTLIYPAELDVSQLPEIVQKMAASLGERTSLKERDLTNQSDLLSREIIEKIRAEGAYLQETKVQVTERVVSGSDADGIFDKK